MSLSGSIEEVVLGAARSLLAGANGDFTMHQLEAEAQVSRATIYRRVGSKETILKRLAAAQGAPFEAPNVRLDILRAARATFTREGFATTTVEQIAADAGVGVATVYRHFGNKEALVRTFIEELTPKVALRDLALHPTGEVTTDLEKLVGELLPFFYRNRDLFRLVFAGREAERRYLEGLREHSDSSFGRLTGYFHKQQVAGRLNPAPRSEDLALALMGMVLAFAVFGPLHYGTTLERPENSSKLIVELFLGDLRG